MGAKELAELAQSGQPAEIVCQFCDQTYVFQPEQLEQLLARLTGPEGGR